MLTLWHHWFDGTCSREFAKVPFCQRSVLHRGWWCGFTFTLFLVAVVVRWLWKADWRTKQLKFPVLLGYFSDAVLIRKEYCRQRKLQELTCHHHLWFFRPPWDCSGTWGRRRTWVLHCQLNWGDSTGDMGRGLDGGFAENALLHGLLQDGGTPGLGGWWWRKMRMLPAWEF